MPTQTVRDQLTTHLGADWRERLVWLDGAPTAAARSARSTAAAGATTPPDSTASSATSR